MILFTEFDCKFSGVLEGSDEYSNLKAIMQDVALCMRKRSGGLWDKYEFIFLGGGEL